MISDAIVEKMARAIYATRVSAQQNTMPWDDLLLEWQDHWRDCARAALSSLAAEGFVVVPKISTPKMRDAGAHAYREMGDIYENVWNAMLSASALPVTQDTK